MAKTKTMSLADLLVTIKHYKGQIALWYGRLRQSMAVNAADEAVYKKKVSYTYIECMEEVKELAEHLIYLKQLRNEHSAEQIEDTYELAELKTFISEVQRLNVHPTYTEYNTDGSGRRQTEEVERFLPVNQKEVDKMIADAQLQVDKIQSRITAYNNQKMLEVREYKPKAE